MAGGAVQGCREKISEDVFDEEEPWALFLKSPEAGPAGKGQEPSGYHKVGELGQGRGNAPHKFVASDPGEQDTGSGLPQIFGKLTRIVTGKPKIGRCPKWNVFKKW